jgi:hypothetical protein
MQQQRGDRIIVSTVCPGCTQPDRFLTVHRGVAAPRGLL